MFQLLGNVKQHGHRKGLPLITMHVYTHGRVKGNCFFLSVNVLENHPLKKMIHTYNVHNLTLCVISRCIQMAKSLRLQVDTGLSGAHPSQILADWNADAVKKKYMYVCGVTAMY